MTDQVRTTPIDEKARAELAQQGLRFDLLPRDDESFNRWLQAVGRGFHGPIIADENLPIRREGFAPRRICAIWDDSIDDAATPVATASSWIMDMTVPGHRAIPTWAISTISVAPTHRRRGIARNLMEAELRTAAELGVPAAILTASEATIYSRFGFEPAAMRADWTIQTKRARWIGRRPEGRLQIVTSEQARDGGAFDLVEAGRLGVPGQVRFEGMLWSRLFGNPGVNNPAEIRVVRYDDAAGEPRGFAIYSANRGDFVATADVHYLNATTDDAYAALWRYLFELDLVTEIKAELRSIDEAFRWQLSDFRAAVESDVHDHLWLRILDAKATLEARQYSAPGTFVLELDDDLGFVEGCYLLSIDESGTASVTRLPSAEGFADNHRLELGAGDLAAVYLGATSFATLVRSGRITEKTPAAAVAADAAFRSEVTPWLSIWF